VLWVCTDDPELARRPRLLLLQLGAAAAAGGLEAAVPVLSWDAVVARAREALDGDCRDGTYACVIGEAGDGSGVVADWFTMAAADVLLSSNSTLSFTAAMVARHGAPGARALRPDPRVGAYVDFDPWASLPLLPAREGLPLNHSLHRHPI
jgi:hypothetical protein